MVRRLSLCALIIILLSAPALAKIPRYTVTDLGTLGGESSHPYGLNNTGEVCGSSRTAAGKPHAFLWRNGQMQDLGTLGGSYSVARAINNNGQIVGSSEVRTGTNIINPCLWSYGPVANIDGCRYGEAFAINDLNVICGIVDGIVRIWINGRPAYDLPFPFNSGIPHDVNNRMQVVGQVLNNGCFRAFLWQDGVTTDLGTLGGKQAVAWAINEQGQIVGWSSIGERVRAFIWQDGMMTDLGDGGALCINNRGEVLGGGPEGKCIWRDGIRQPLSDLVPDTLDLWGYQPRGLNDAGQIILDRYLADNGEPQHGLLLTPIPVRKVQIDIMPGEERNAIGLSWKGTFQVVVFTTPELDAADVDAKNVELAGALSVTRCLRDVDRDGDLDLLLNFRYRDLHLTENSTEATLMGTVPDEYIIEGTDSVDIIHAGRWGR